MADKFRSLPGGPGFYAALVLCLAVAGGVVAALIQRFCNIYTLIFRNVSNNRDNFFRFYGF